MKNVSPITTLRWVQKVEPSEAGIAAARSQVTASIGRLGLHDTYRFSIELCLQEALVNALVHGVREHGGETIILSCDIDADRIRITVKDDGSGGSGAKKCQASGHDVESNGWGVFLIRAFMSRVSVHVSGHAIHMELDFDEGLHSGTYTIQPMGFCGRGVHAGKCPTIATDFHAH